MGQTESSIQKQISLENIRAECGYNNFNERNNRFGNKGNKKAINEKDFDERSSTNCDMVPPKGIRKGSKAQSVGFRYFKSNLNQNGALTNDVELIVRKKLITTTTTTTMSPVELNKVLNSLNDDGQVESIESLNEKEVQKDDSLMENHGIVIKNNDTDPKDITNQINESSSSNLINQSAQQSENALNKNNFNLLIQSENGDKRISTIKKEQLEYEFRIKPKSEMNSEFLVETKRKKKYKYGELESGTNRSITSNECDEVIYQRFFCFGIKCCQMPYKSRDEEVQRHFDDETISQNLEFDTTKTGESKKKDFDDSNNDTSLLQNNDLSSRIMHIISYLCCCFIFTNSQGYHTICGKKLNIKNRYYLNDKLSNNQIYSGNENNQHNNNKSNFDYINDTERSEGNLIGQPIKCIRVLRPSNDLTPVRFDSHYNIIQAYSADNTSLICSNEVQINDTVNENASMPFMDNEVEGSENNNMVEC